MRTAQTVGWRQLSLVWVCQSFLMALCIDAGTVFPDVDDRVQRTLAHISACSRSRSASFAEAASALAAASATARSAAASRDAAACASVAALACCNILETASAVLRWRCK